MIAPQPGVNTIMARAVNPATHVTAPSPDRSDLTRHRLTGTTTADLYGGGGSINNPEQKGDRPWMVAYTTMIWIALCLPLMVLGLAIATIPIIWAMIHEHRYGSAEIPISNDWKQLSSLRSPPSMLT